MKFECDKSLLSAAIDGVSRAITNRAAIPVLEGIYLKAEGFQLTLTGYDMEMGITTNIECNVQVPGETVLEAKLFGSMVSRMPSGTVSVELNNEGMAIISGGVAEFEIPAMNASDYPSLPNTAAENTMTIPTSMMRELLKITGGPDEPVKIDANRRYVVFTTNGYTIMSRLIEGEFLNYESVIPKESRTKVVIDCKSFIDTLERASLIITDRLKNPLRINFAPDKVTVRCQTPLGKVVDEFTPESMEGDSMEIGFNNRYLLDALRYSKCEKLRLEINGPLSPVKVLPVEGEDFIYLVLPVRFKNEG